MVPICLYRWLARTPHSAFRFPPSAFCLPHSAFRTPHSAFCFLPSALHIPHFAPPRANALSNQGIMISHGNSIVKPFLSTLVLACKGFRLLAAETHRPHGRFYGAPAPRRPPGCSYPSGSSDRLHLGPARCRHSIARLVEVVAIVLDTAPPTVIRSGSASPCGTPAGSLAARPPASKRAARAVDSLLRGSADGRIIIPT